jgi:ribonuclease R
LLLQAQDFPPSPPCGVEGQNGRVDLRDIPLVTIDGADARDFDDAVFAESDNKGGWHVIVAIADVAHYVKPGSALDKDAYDRGNSTYFPDRVVPMLPEKLSNGLCSLMPNVERACMAVHLWLDKEGELTRWQFVRGVMKSRARLTYEQVQAAYDGKPDTLTGTILDTVIKPLYGAYACLMRARLKRGTLELELPERKVVLNKDGTVKAIVVRERLESHKLIEEFMIAANVAAAAQLEGKGGLCIYRIHDKPSEIKLDALRDFLDSFGISLVPAKQLHPRMLTHILENAAGGPNAQVINEVMLRSQAQAIYSRDNIGHFGLALAKYAHFTSPIRRYADLIVHRALIRTGNLGKDGLTDAAIERLETIADHISQTERRSITAERDAIDRFTTLFLADKIGTVFPARISGVARFGLFARLDETGADGMIPFNALPHDFYHFDEARHALIGQRTKRSYQLGMLVKVRLEKADKLTGSLGFVIVEEDQKKPPRHESRKRGSVRQRR